MKKVLILLGPTCVGKTSASIRLARHMDTEIISADSMQIYRYMDIGTAKPSSEQLRAVRHHMIGIVNPWDYYSTGRFVDDVTPLIEALHSQGRIPLIVGGTGLYIKAMTRGIFRGPSADWTVRRDLLRAGDSATQLHERLRSLDPVAASRIMPHDTRRIVRALEVCLTTERRISELQRTETSPLPYDYYKIGLTRERNELYRLVESRVDRMIQQGLVDEVRAVLRVVRENGGIGEEIWRNAPALQAIGYKEIALYLDGLAGLEEAVHLVKKRTKTYVRRQFIWFRKEEGIHWIDLTGAYTDEEISERVVQCLPDSFGEWIRA